MASRQFTNMLASRLVVPSPYEDERMADVMTGGQKRNFSGVRDLTETVISTMNKRRFTGDAALGPLRSAVPDQLSRRMNVVNTGFSSGSAHTDEEIVAPLFAKPFAQGWEQDYVEKMPLFSNRVEPEQHSMNMHTLASVQVLNFVSELGALTDSRNALVARAGVADELVQMREYLEYMIPSVKPGVAVDSLASSIAEKWAYLGPMMTFQDAGIHSSDAQVRRAQGAQRMINFSVYNRAKTFNVFGEQVRKGDQLFFVAKEIDVSHLKNFVDPRGQAVVARTTFPARAMQVVGFSQHDAPVPFHNTGYDPVSGPDSFADPVAGDRDYVQRARRIAQDYQIIDIDDGTDAISFRGTESDAVREHLRSTPELVYRAYMEGTVFKVGTARSFEGRRPSNAAIREGLRSHEAMKRLQTVEIYNV